MRSRYSIVIALGFAAVLACLAGAGTAQAAALGSAFTYQRLLQEAGAPFGGAADFDFSLWDADVDGNQIGATVTLLDVAVTEGVFTVELDFGAAALDGNERWLDVEVGGIMLSPRQETTGAPYSIQTRGIFVDDVGSDSVTHTWLVK